MMYYSGLTTYQYTKLLKLDPPLAAVYVPHQASTVTEFCINYYKLSLS